MPEYSQASESHASQEVSAGSFPQTTSEEQVPSHLAAVPALNLNSITEERNKRNATTNKRSYALEADASVLGTTVEIDAISPVPGLPHTVSHVNRVDSVKEPTPQMPVDASEMRGVPVLEEGTAGTSNHTPQVMQSQDDVHKSDAHAQPQLESILHGVVSPYKDAADTKGMTAIMGDQTALMTKTDTSLNNCDSDVVDVQEAAGATATTSSLPGGAVSDSLPPGAIVRGRDEFLDQLQSKPAEGTGNIAPSKVIHQDTTGIFASPWENSDQGPRAVSRAGTYVPSDSASLMSGGSGMSSWTLSSHAPARSVRRSAFTTMPSSSRSGRWSSRASNMAPTASSQSNWTLSGDKSNWTLSGAEKSVFTMGGDQSNWTLSGNTGNFSGASRRVATRPIDDGPGEAFTLGFTEGASEWGLSPRGTARDDLDIGHSERASLRHLLTC